ncbi:hypothetical protein [Phocaeicola sp.]
MKKYVFLLVCLIGITSCTDHKDLYNPDNESEQKKEEYDKNFPVTDVDPNQDWNSFTTAKVSVTVYEDWGETYTVKVYTANPLDKNSGAMLLAKGDVKNGGTFTADVELPKGLMGVYAARINSVGEWLVKYSTINNGSASITFGSMTRGRNVVQSRGLNLDDVKQNSPYSESEIESYLNSAIELKNGKLDNLVGDYKVTSDYILPSEIHSENSHALVIIEEGVTLTTSRVGRGVTIIVMGTLNVTDNCQFTETSKIVVFPKGRITGDYLNMTNGNDASFYNAGTVKLGTLIVNGGAFYNCGDINVGYLQNSGGGGKIVNNGYLNAERVALQGTDIFVLCHTVFGTFNTEGAGIGFQNCYIADNAYLEVKKELIGNSSQIYLGDRSILYIGQYTYNNSKINGPSDSNEKAYIKIDGVTSWWGNGSSSGYYTIDVNYSSLDDWAKGVFEHDVLGHGTSLERHFAEAKLELKVPAQGECSGKVVINGKDDEDVINAATYAFEDLGSVGDYDFNDVVFKVSHLSGSTEATVELLAAGGTLKTAVKYNNEVLWSEVHEAFGASTNTMINTGKGSGTKIPDIKTITVPADALFKDLNFSIVVTDAKDETKTSSVVSTPTVGGAPQCLCIPAIWKWPKENVSIVKAYNTESHSFGDWAGNVNQANDWYEHPVAGQVF